MHAEKLSHDRKSEQSAGLSGMGLSKNVTSSELTLARLKIES
jgi:hypothetical protein